jgi:hypothetical protein
MPKRTPPVVRRRAKEMKARRMRSKPTYVEAVKAVNYWVLFDDMASFFQQAEMPVVSEHLQAACREIDRIWEEGDYDRGQQYTC